MNKRVNLICIACIFMALSVTGCFGKEEINQLTIIAGVGMDVSQKEEGIQLTVQAILPEEIQEQVKLEEGQRPVWLGTVTGDSIFDAVRNLSLLTGSRILWGHSQVLIIGEEAARQGIKETIDWFERSPEFRRRTFTMVAKGEARSIIEAKEGIDKIPAFNIGKLNEGSENTSKVVSRDLRMLISTLSSKTTCAILPGITVYNKIDREGKENKATKIQDTAVFKDYKLIGWLNEKETRGLLWVLGEVKSGVIDVQHPKDEERFISFEIIRAGSKIKPRIKDNKVTIIIEINEKGNIASVPSPIIDISKPKNILELEEAKKSAIEKDVSLALTKAKEMNADIFGIGEAIHRDYPKEWKKLEQEWDSIFPNLEIEVRVSSKLRRTGLITINKN